ncbi:hypothetical protein CFP56_015173 [Quercus suber]|uniref:Uncharacterized protein n=1 Tax=Quercus suber TaxID=58331 RepID=A0AAW0KQV3_QUESU
MNLEKFLVNLTLISTHSMLLKKNWVEVSLGLLIFVQREPQDENTRASPFQASIKGTFQSVKLLRLVGRL